MTTADVRYFSSPPTWVDHAACAGTDGAGFFPDDNHRDVSEAIKFCGRCPVRTQCLTYAIENEEVWGVWGGRDMRPPRKKAKKVAA